MSLDADTIVDRRRLRRKLTFWRVLTALVIVAAIGGAAALFSGRDGLASRPGNFIARIKVQGVIRGDTERVEALERLGKSNARAVILHVDSPGGTTAGSEQLLTALRKLAAQKPMVVVVDGIAASGGYITAMSADYIVAQSTSLVGSIGVIFQYPNVAELLKTVGIKVEEIKSSPLKAAPNGFEPTSSEARAAIESIVKDSNAWFRGIVTERRKLEGPALETAADGRIFTGRQAVELKLVDEVGDEAAAIAWLAKSHPCTKQGDSSSASNCVDAKWPVRDWQLRDRIGNLSFLHLGVSALFESVGLHTLAQRFADTGTLQAIERMNLDGLLALWHPPAAN